ncbi:MAG: gliding motility-associated C-terminal domain-containing protein [Elusimicrobiales bacterium]|nr:gliding motility-associated C-terminal domain-containing protein [Elusimicrobiales bacterium]
MKYKSVGLALAGVALACGVLPAAAANMMETRAFTSGLAISNSGGYALESTVGEVSGSTMAASGKGLRSGHAGTSHSPGAVYDLTASTSSANDVLFQWTSVGSEGLVGQASALEIKIATFPVTYANYSTINSSLTLAALTAGTVDQKLYSGLQAGKTYYVAIRVRDSSNMYGRLSANASFGTAPVRPRAPVVRGVLAGGNFTMSWDAVLYNTEGSTISIKNYEVYSSTALTGTVSAAITLSSSTLSYTVATSPVKWYFVKTLDSDNVRSESSIWLSNADDVVRTVSEDRRAIVDLPPFVDEDLRAAGLVPVMESQPAFETGATVVSYKFYLRDASNNEVKRTLPQDVTLTMPLSKTGSFTVSAFSPAASYSDYDYAVYYYNGVEDVKLGGTVNPESGSVAVVTRQTGLFKVKRVVRAQSFSITQTVPRKTFTPNGDGIWDEFNIIFENPEGLSISSAKIYDLSGAEIATLRAGTYNSEASLSWDGRRSGGDKAQAGIYVYQFKAGSKYYNGTVVLAR